MSLLHQGAILDLDRVNEEDTAGHWVTWWMVGSHVLQMSHHGEVIGHLFSTALPMRPAIQSRAVSVSYTFDLSPISYISWYRRGFKKFALGRILSTPATSSSLHHTS
eukprot:scaffold11057_cov66-Skeletonema_marinoi.AAC.3